jgi:hypothetical protein
MCILSFPDDYLCKAFPSLISDHKYVFKCYEHKFVFIVIHHNTFIIMHHMKKENTEYTNHNNSAAALGIHSDINTYIQ